MNQARAVFFHGRGQSRDVLGANNINSREGDGKVEG